MKVYSRDPTWPAETYRGCQSSSSPMGEQPLQSAFLFSGCCLRVLHFFSLSFAKEKTRKYTSYTPRDWPSPFPIDVLLIQPHLGSQIRAL